MELGPEEAMNYRSIAARANDLSADRPDIIYAVKDLCRGVAKPTKGHWLKLKHLGRYLIERGGTIMRYDCQGHGHEVTGYSDSEGPGAE